MKAFNEIKNQLVVTDKNMEEAIRGNRSLVKPYKNSAKMKMDWFIQDHLWMIPKPILRYLLKRKE